MKKLFSLSLAVLMVAVMTVTAFAAVEGISLDADISGVDINHHKLRPGAEYKFPVKITENGEIKDVTEAHMEDHKFSVSITKGASAISSAEVQEIDGAYYLVVKTKSNYAAGSTDVAFKLRYQEKETSKEVTSSSFELKVGFSTMSNSTIESLVAGDPIVVDPSTPVLTEEQIETIAKLNGYKNVTLSYGDWTYTNRITDLKDLNLFSSTDAYKELLTKYEDHNFKFLSFPGKPDFGAKGTLTIDVADELDRFDNNFHLYKYEDGYLYRLSFQFNEDESTISFTPSKLGNYVITDKEIPDAITSNNSGSSNNSSSNAGSNSGSNSEDVLNPGTGSATFASLAAACSLIAIAGCGLVAWKKK